MEFPTAGRAKIGFVLSGGGSRGAYEAGIIQYLRNDLPKRVGHAVPIDIVTGTSVGAINATFMAATMEEPASQGDRLVENWKALRIEQLLGLRATDLFKAGRLLFGAEPPPPTPGSYRYGGLLDTSGLERFVVKAIPWRGIERSLRSRALSALSISTTHVGTGHTVVYLQSADPVPREWSRDPFVRHRAARIGPRHVLASAAIPLLFPAVKIGEEFFTDGGLRQNTPMSPAIRMGADRMLLISLRHIAKIPKEIQKERTEAYPKPLFLLGKALNALLLDHTEYDLDRMQRLNAILEAGAAAFGAEFQTVMNRELLRLRGAALRRIEAVHIRPSMDIGVLAAEFVAKGKIEVHGRVAKRLLARLAAGEAAHESDLLSYLLFDGNYATELVELGRRDAAAQEEQLVKLFCDPLTNDEQMRAEPRGAKVPA